MNAGMGNNDWLHPACPAQSESTEAPRSKINLKRRYLYHFCKAEIIIEVS